MEVFRKDLDRFDLVITDMTMPKMTRDELSKELLKIRSNIPIILCTGFSDKIDEIKTKDLQVFYGGAKKADWDVGMAVDAISLSSKLDAIILATGDGDFVPLVEYLKYSTGCQVEVISFGKSTSSQLREASEDFFDLCDDHKKYLIGGSNWKLPRP